MIVGAAALQMVVGSAALAGGGGRTFDVAEDGFVGAAEERDERVIRSKPFQKAADAECEDNVCNIVLKTLGKSRRLLVRNVSCRIRSSIAAVPNYVGLIANSDDDAGHTEFYVPTIISGSAPDETWTFNQQTTFYAFALSTVYLRSSFSFGSLDAMTCSVSGEIQKVE